MGMSGNQNRTRRVTLCGLLLALMLVLGFVEHLLPDVGVPGVKLGLSNSVLIFAVCMLDIPTAFILMVLKVALSAVLFSGVQAMAYAFAGGMMSLIGMCLLYRIKGLPLVCVSMAGGVLHNAGQAAMSILILNLNAPVYFLILLLSGLACGLLTGIAAQKTIQHFKRAFGALAPAQRHQRASVPLLALAVLLSAGMCFFAWRTLKAGRPAAVVPDDGKNQVQMLPTDQLPLSPNLK